MTANCAATAVNALVTRHLAFNPHPLTKLPGEPYVYSKGSKREIAALYHEHLVEGAWRKGKSLRKQQQIEESIRYDHLRLHKIKAHVKTEVLLNKPKKARLIQAFVSLLTIIWWPTCTRHILPRSRNGQTSLGSILA